MQSILFEAKRLAAIMEEGVGAKIQGQLVVGIIPTVAPYLLPRLLPVLSKDYPDLQLKIFEMQTQRISEALDDDEIDVGILATPLKSAKLHEQSLYLEPFSVLCKKNSELSKFKRLKYSLLTAEDIWLLEEGHCLRHQAIDICSQKSKLQVQRKYQFESGSLETLKNLVNSYGGFTLLPQMATDSLGSNTLLIPFERPIPAREIGLVTRREHYKREFVDALKNAILNSIPASLTKIRPKDLDVLPVT
jgi:LysR family hydrogen peroxide-inducible transcriptional activator